MDKEERNSFDWLSSQSIDDKTSNRAFLFFRNDHAIRFILQKEGTSVPRALVLGTLLLKNLCFLVLKVYEYITIIFNAAINVLDLLLLIKRNANQVYTLATKTIYLAYYLPLLQRNKEVYARHSRSHHLIYVVFKHLRHRLIFKIAFCSPLN